MTSLREKVRRVKVAKEDVVLAKAREDRVRTIALIGAPSEGWVKGPWLSLLGMGQFDITTGRIVSVQDEDAFEVQIRGSNILLKRK